MTTAPLKIRALQEARQLEIQWNDGTMTRLPYRFLRGECPCAACVDEMTGRRILDVESIPHGIQPANVSLVGNYALKIDWNDGHSTGMYTWDRLAELSRTA